MGQKGTLLPLFKHGIFVLFGNHYKETGMKYKFPFPTSNSKSIMNIK